MKINLTEQETELLKEAGIQFDAIHDYTDDEAITLLEQVRDVEVSFAQFTGGDQEKKYYKYGNLADKIYAIIPE